MLEMVAGRRVGSTTGFVQTDFGLGFVLGVVVVWVDLRLRVTLGIFVCPEGVFFVLPFVVILFKVCIIYSYDII